LVLVGKFSAFVSENVLPIKSCCFKQARTLLFSFLLFFDIYIRGVESLHRSLYSIKRKLRRGFCFGDFYYLWKLQDLREKFVPIKLLLLPSSALHDRAYCWLFFIDLCYCHALARSIALLVQDSEVEVVCPHLHYA